MHLGAPDRQTSQRDDADCGGRSGGRGGAIGDGGGGEERDGRDRTKAAAGLTLHIFDGGGARRCGYGCLVLGAGWRGRDGSGGWGGSDYSRRGAPHRTAHRRLCCLFLFRKDYS